MTKIAAPDPFKKPDLGEPYKAKTELPPEAQALFQRRRQMLKSDLAREKEARKKAMQQRLSLTGLGASGIAQKQDRVIDTDIARERERGEGEILSAEQQYALGYGEAERGREFQSSENAKNRAIQQQALDLQKALGLGYEDPNTGEWVKGSAEIANIELEESLKNDVTNAIQAFKDLGMDDLTKMRPFLEGIYGEERVGEIYAGLDDFTSSYDSSSSGSRGDSGGGERIYNDSGVIITGGAHDPRATIPYAVINKGLDPREAVERLVRAGYNRADAEKLINDTVNRMGSR